MNPTLAPKDRFLPKWSLLLAVFITATIALLRSDHTFWAAVTSATSALVALTIGGWLAAGRYLEADIVVAIRAQGGRLPKHRLPESSVRDQLLLRLSQEGVVTVSDEIVILHEEKVGRVLALFIRIRMG
jgi:hypothetical protein